MLREGRGKRIEKKSKEREHGTDVDGFTQLNNSLTLQSVLLSRTERMWVVMQRQRKPTIWAAKEDRGRDWGRGLKKVN